MGPNNNYEEFKEQPSSMNEEMEVTFSVADGVATAQDALPETQHDKSGGFSQRELALLKEVDTRDGRLIEMIHKQNEMNQNLDELEDYIVFMERDLEQKAVFVGEDLEPC